MAKRIAALIVLLGLAAGCASEREQNLKRFEAMHDDVRKTPADPPAKWEMNPGSAK